MKNQKPDYKRIKYLEDKIIELESSKEDKRGFCEFSPKFGKVSGPFASANLVKEKEYDKDHDHASCVLLGGSDEYVGLSINLENAYGMGLHQSYVPEKEKEVKKEEPAIPASIDSYDYYKYVREHSTDHEMVCTVRNECEKELNRVGSPNVIPEESRDMGDMLLRGPSLWMAGCDSKAQYGEAKSLNMTMTYNEY
jgi:hypothetical protein